MVHALKKLRHAQVHSTDGSGAAFSTTLVSEGLTACGMWKLTREHKITPCQPHVCVQAVPVDVTGHRFSQMGLLCR